MPPRRHRPRRMEERTTCCMKRTCASRAPSAWARRRSQPTSMLVRRPRRHRRWAEMTRRVTHVGSGSARRRPAPRPIPGARPISGGPLPLHRRCRSPAARARTTLSSSGRSTSAKLAPPPAHAPPPALVQSPGSRPAARSGSRPAPPRPVRSASTRSVRSVTTRFHRDQMSPAAATALSSAARPIPARAQSPGSRPAARSGSRPAPPRPVRSASTRSVRSVTTRFHRDQMSPAAATALSSAARPIPARALPPSPISSSPARSTLVIEMPTSPLGGGVASMLVWHPLTRFCRRQAARIFTAACVHVRAAGAVERLSSSFLSAASYL